jgi:phytanoyl-CoA hydroxylase
VTIYAYFGETMEKTGACSQGVSLPTDNKTSAANAALSLEVPLTGDELSQLNDLGYVVVRGALPGDALQSIRAALADVVDRMARDWLTEGLIKDPHENAPFETRWMLIRRQLPAKRPVTWRRVLVSRAIYDLWRRPELTGRMRSSLGDELWAHDTWNGRPREPNAPVQKINWHQDAHYLRFWQPADGNVLTCWIPLVPVDVPAGCLQIIPRSHTWGVLRPKFDEFYNRNLPDAKLPVAEAVSVEAVPGDVVIFTERTVHQALHNNADYVRWSVDIRFGVDSPIMRSKACGGFLCRTAGDIAAMETFEEWAAKYDKKTGSMASRLRLIEAAAARSGSMARDMITY